MDMGINPCIHGIYICVISTVTQQIVPTFAVHNIFLTQLHYYYCYYFFIHELCLYINVMITLRRVPSLADRQRVLP